MKKYIDKVYGSFRDATFLNRYKLPTGDYLENPQVFDKIHQLRVPQMESGSREILDKVFPEFKGNIKSIKMPDIQEVLLADRTEVDVYCRDKRIYTKYFAKSDIKVIIKHVTQMFLGLNDYTKYTDIISCIGELPSNTSSCYPLFIKKGDNRNIEDVTQRINEFLKRTNIFSKINYLYKHPSVIFHRFTPKMKGNNNKGYSVKYKIRQIFGISHFICVLEVMYLKYFVDNFKINMTGRFTIGLTRSEVSELVGRVRTTALHSDRSVMCGDISGCDKSISQNFHSLFASILCSFIPNTHDKINVITILNYLCYTPIASSDRKIHQSIGSTTSGSWITSIFNTFVVYFVLCYCYLKLYNRLPNVGEVLCQGDDFILCIDAQDQKKVKEIFKKFNLRLKLGENVVCKGYDNIEYLGFLWDKNNEPFQHNSWFYSRTAFPEKVVQYPGPDRIISRYLSLIFQTKDYFDLLKKFIDADQFLKLKLSNQKDPILKFFDSLGNVISQRFPISRLLTYGWRMFWPENQINIYFMQRLLDPFTLEQNEIFPGIIKSNDEVFKSSADFTILQSTFYKVFFKAISYKLDALDFHQLRQIKSAFGIHVSKDSTESTKLISRMAADIYVYLIKHLTSQVTTDSLVRHIRTSIKEIPSDLLYIVKTINSHRRGTSIIGSFNSTIIWTDVNVEVYTSEHVTKSDLESPYEVMSKLSRIVLFNRILNLSPIENVTNQESLFEPTEFTLNTSTSFKVSEKENLTEFAMWYGQGCQEDDLIYSILILPRYRGLESIMRYRRIAISDSDVRDILDLDREDLLNPSINTTSNGQLVSSYTQNKLVPQSNKSVSFGALKGLPGIQGLDDDPVRISKIKTKNIKKQRNARKKEEIVEDTLDQESSE